MSDEAPSQWAADPYRRHELRYWDGHAWTEHVRDGALPSLDPVLGLTGLEAGADTTRDSTRPILAVPTSPPHPSPEAPAPLLSGKVHVLLALVTLGLWLIVAPAIYWARRRAVKPLVAWSAVWIALFVIGALGGGNTPPSTLTTAASAPPGASQASSTAASAVPTPTSVSPQTTTASATPASPPITSRKPSSSAGAWKHLSGSRAARTTSQAASATKPTTKATSERTAKPTNQPTSEPTAKVSDPRFRTCKEAKAQGYGPYYKSKDPEYYWYRDSDHDGVDCE